MPGRQDIVYISGVILPAHIVLSIEVRICVTAKSLGSKILLLRWLVFVVEFDNRISKVRLIIPILTLF